MESMLTGGEFHRFQRAPCLSRDVTRTSGQRGATNLSLSLLGSGGVPCWQLPGRAIFPCFDLSSLATVLMALTRAETSNKLEPWGKGMTALYSLSYVRSKLLLFELCLLMLTLKCCCCWKMVQVFIQTLFKLKGKHHNSVDEHLLCMQMVLGSVSASPNNVSPSSFQREKFLSETLQSTCHSVVYSQLYPRWTAQSYTTFQHQCSSM